MRIPFSSSGILVSAFVASCLPSGQAFTAGGKFATLTANTRSLTTSSALGATPADAIATMDASQTASVSKIEAAMPGLLKRPDLSWTDADGVTIAGCAATLDGREAPGADGNVAWLSSLCVQSKISALTIYNGPLTCVPHLLSACAVVNDNTLVFNLDFRPRGYGAYELRDAEGNYPGPDQLGRDAFTYSGNRLEYDKKFGTPEVISFMESTMASFEGATTNARPATELDLLTRGPLCMDVTMPLTDGNVAAVTAARAQAVDYFITWATTEKDEHAHRPGAPINAQFVYDTKYKQNAYGALLDVYSGIFGPDEGAKLAAADSGPLDEAYVGGGS